MTGALNRVTTSPNYSDGVRTLNRTESQKLNLNLNAKIDITLGGRLDILLGRKTLLWQDSMYSIVKTHSTLEPSIKLLQGKLI